MTEIRFDIDTSAEYVKVRSTDAEHDDTYDTDVLSDSSFALFHAGRFIASLAKDLDAVVDRDRMDDPTVWFATRHTIVVRAGMHSPVPVIPVMALVPSLLAGVDPEDLVERPWLFTSCTCGWLRGWSQEYPISELSKSTDRHLIEVGLMTGEVPF